MKKFLMFFVLVQIAQLNNAVVGLNNAPVGKDTIIKVISNFRDFRHLGNFKINSILTINDANKSKQINFEDYIYFGEAQQLATTNSFKNIDIHKFKSDSSSLKNIRKKHENTYWFLVIENETEDIQNYYIKVGNNKLSEIHFYSFKNNSDTITDKMITGLNTSQRFDLLTPAFPISIQTCDIIELLIYMPKRHYMLDMNTSINLSNENLPISIKSADKELKDTMVYFFFYGAFICFYLFYIFVLIKLLNVFNKPLIRDSKGNNLRFWFTSYIFLGGLALIATTGVGYNIASTLFNFLVETYPFIFNSSIQQVLAYIDSVSVHVFAALFIMVGFVLFKRGVPVFENVFWFKIIYYPVLIMLTIIVIGSLLFKQVCINHFWLFYDFRTFCFVVFNILGYAALSTYLYNTENRFALKLEKIWIKRAFGLYSIILLSLFYAVITTSLHLPMLNALPNPYIFIYTCLFVFAGLLTWFLFYRIDLLMHKYFASNERVKQIGSNISIERERMKTAIHDEIGPMFTRINLALSDVENKVTDSNNIQVLKRIKFTSQDIVKKIYHIVEDSKNSTDFSLKSRLLNYIEELQYTPGMTAFIDRYININEATYKNQILTEDILMIVKELLNNAVKYSKSDSIELKLFEENDYLFIEVTDNGIGFDLRDIVIRRKQIGKIDTGILAIKKRVKENYGKIKIKTSAVLNEGTLIQIKFPLFTLHTLPSEENVTWEYLNLKIKDFIRFIFSLIRKLTPRLFF